MKDFSTLQKEELADNKELLSQGLDVNVNSDAQKYKMPILDGTRKIRFFDYKEGKYFAVSLPSKAVHFIVVLMALLLSALPIFSTKLPAWSIPIFLIVGGTFAFAMVLNMLRSIDVRLDGIEIRNVKWGVCLRKRFVKWDSIVASSYYVKSYGRGSASLLDFVLSDGTKETVNLSALNANCNMIYNLIAAYHSFSQVEQFDWYRVMRKEEEKESVKHSIFFSAIVSVASFFVIACVLVNVIANTYDETIPDNKYDMEESLISQIKSSICHGSGESYAYVWSAYKEKNLVSVELGDKYGVYNYADNTWLLAPSKVGRYEFSKNYISIEKSFTFYDYDGNDESFMVNVILSSYIWLALLGSLLIGWFYYRYRQTYK